jgi:nucleoside-diphosphate-sugar epimerase
MRALVTGASGYLGRHLVRRLLDEDVDIIAMARDANAQPWPSSSRLQPASCDLGHVPSVRRLAEQAGPVDVVFHMAAVTSGSHAEAMRGTVVGSQNLVDAFAATRARVVLASSFSVYKFSALRKWALLDENAPIEDCLRLRDSYTITKTRQEALVREQCARQGLPLVVIRPGKIYGPDTVALPPQLGLDLKGVAYLWMGGNHLLPLTHVSNCADAIYLAGVRDGAVGETLNIVDDDLPTQKAFMRLYRECCGPLDRAVRIPDWTFALFVRMMERANRSTKGNVPPVLTRYRAAALWKPLRYSNQRAKNALGWEPKIGWAEGVKAMLSTLPGASSQPSEQGR